MSARNFFIVLAMVVPLCLAAPAAKADWNSDLEQAKKGEISLEKAVKNALAAGKSVDKIVASALAAQFDRTRITAALLSAGAKPEAVVNALAKAGGKREEAAMLVTTVLASLPIPSAPAANYGSTPVTGGGTGGGGTASPF